MEKLNYKKLGFKAGLEIHQQLDGKKLFCKCPVKTNKKETPDLTIKRKIRAVAGESGKKDIAALYEEKKDKTFIYEFYQDCNCLVEIDEEPPNNINQDSLEAALQLSLLLKAKIEPKIKIMRKIVIDGSNVSGFQRTMLISTNGKIKTSKGTVKIETILLEEEAAKKIASNGKDITYRLDRLGVPLIEIATSPDIKDPEHAKETAETIGMILRSIDLTKRGLGTIRQDINLSIKNSPRIEIKGFQDLRSIPKITEYETKRLINDPPKKGEVRKAEKDLTTTFLRPLPGKARMYPETDHKEIEITGDLLSKITPPELITERTLNLERKYNLSPQLAAEIVKKKVGFIRYTKEFPRLSPKIIAYILVEAPKELRSRFHVTKKLKASDFEFIIENLNSNKIPRDAILDVFLKLSKGLHPNLTQYSSLSDKEIEKTIETIIAENQGAPFNALMGIAMSKLKNRVEGKKIAETIKKFT
ncbi:MAG: Glu-tRNA(Gln) amidotransferase GatDE subunit E [Nanoarchaeota archaeon]|nr:Glu-tRNA(Gln) amidotransferase GatDE subunit E [Nanoarchaeota archaeon]